MAQSHSSSSVSSHLIEDANPGRRFYKCYLHGFFKWADTEEATEWQKLSLLEARDQIRRLRDDKKSLYNEIAEFQRQLTIQATAQQVNRAVEEETDLNEINNSGFCSGDKMLCQFLIISWGGFIVTTAIIIYTMKH
ncbi:hypothetical protein Bca4012_037135 [Brassica carinata]